MNNVGRIQFLDCPIDSLTMDQTVDRCLGWSKEAVRRPHFIVTVNTSTLVEMRRDERLRLACEAADLIVPDGVPVVWATRLMGTPLIGRVAGVDLMERLLEDGSRHGLRVYFLGAKQEVIDKLVSLCSQRYPGLVIVGTRNGYFGEEEHGQIIQDIRESDADVLFIGMPSPFKEAWCHRHKEDLGVPVQVGVGGSFDVIAGYIKRAPRWMQKIGMEWAWRLMMEPRRLWKRYLTSNSMFIWLTLQTFFSRRTPSSR